MDFFRKHKKEILFATGIAGVTAVVAGVWYLFTNIEEEDTQNPGEEEEKEARSPFFREFEIKRENGILSIETMKKIYMNFTILTKRIFAIKLTQIRKRRRAATSDAEYIQILREYLGFISTFSKEIFRRYLPIWKVDGKEFEASTAEYMQQGNEEFLELVGSAMLLLDMAPESKHPVDKETFKKAMEYQVKFLVDNKESLAQLVRDNPEVSEVIVKHKMEDHLYEKFEIEEEDLFAFVQSSTDPEIRKFNSCRLEKLDNFVHGEEKN